MPAKEGEVPGNSYWLVHNNSQWLVVNYSICSFRYEPLSPGCSNEGGHSVDWKLDEGGQSTEIRHYMKWKCSGQVSKLLVRKLAWLGDSPKGNPRDRPQDDVVLEAKLATRGHTRFGMCHHVTPSDSFSSTVSLIWDLRIMVETTFSVSLWLVAVAPHFGNGSHSFLSDLLHPKLMNNKLLLV